MGEGKGTSSARWPQPFSNSPPLPLLAAAAVAIGKDVWQTFFFPFSSTCRSSTIS